MPERARDFSDRGRLCLSPARGIGRALARQFAAFGAIRMIADLVLDNAQSVKAEIEAAGGRATVLHVNVADGASVDAMVAAILAGSTY